MTLVVHIQKNICNLRVQST